MAHDCNFQIRAYVQAGEGFSGSPFVSRSLDIAARVDGVNRQHHIGNPTGFSIGEGV